MPVRGPLVRLLWWTVALGAGVLAVVGGLALRGSGLVAVGVAGMLIACIAVGMARDEPGHDRRSMLEAAVQALCWTVGVVLVLAGVAALAGGLVALLAGVAGLGAGLITYVARARRRAASGVEVHLRPVPSTPPMGTPSSPLSAMTTSALGREWMRTTAALGGHSTPADRAALVRRREETLDELERRDPAGFARWLATGAASGSDPATYIHARRIQDDPTAGTDAA